MLPTHPHSQIFSRNHPPPFLQDESVFPLLHCAWGPLLQSLLPAGYHTFEEIEKIRRNCRVCPFPALAMMLAMMLAVTLFGGMVDL